QLVHRVEVHTRHRALRRRRLVDGPRAGGQAPRGEVQQAMTAYDDESAHAAEATPVGATVPHPDGEHASPLNYQHPESEAMLRRVAELIAGARPMPLSASVMINKDEILELIEEAIE